MRNKEKEAAKAANNKVGGAVRELLDKKNTVDTYWGELDNLYSVVGTGVITVMVQLQQINDKMGLTLKEEHRKEQAVLINGAIKDIEGFVDELTNIKKKHEGKVGKIIGDDDYMLSLELGSEYESFNIKFKSIIGPIFSSIIENYAASVKVAKAEADTKDPNVITDVEVTEVKPYTAQ